jgi:nucleoside-diphosphate-sugar epimerase
MSEIEMSTYVIFGGSGYLGTHLAQHLLEHDASARVHIADIRPSPLQKEPRVSVSQTDVRDQIPSGLTPQSPAWIFNLAAVHREPGHKASEYFATNLPGAENVCRYAGAVGCSKLFFSSSISVYGLVERPADEQAPISPNSAYGASKYAAEWVHRVWLAGGRDRRLVVCRPGVIFGPADPGNVLRMIRAVKHGYFVFPGRRDIYKSYAYIYGLLDSIDFVMRRTDPFILYNYVDQPNEQLGEIVRRVKAFVGRNTPILGIPSPFLLPLAHLMSTTLGVRTVIHPTRVRKAAMSTHIVPGWLLAAGFHFRYPFDVALHHWVQASPADFS